MYIDVRECPPHVRAALEAIGYGARDIELVAAESFSPYSEAGKGSRGVCVIVNLATGEREQLRGSWGGSNPFARTLVDDSQELVPMPANAAVIKGQTGYPRTFARILVHPDALPRLLPAAEQDRDALTDAEQQAIYCFAAIKGGAYRRDELARRNVSAATVDDLVARGYLKRARNGATSITTRGKNARTIRF
jgi:hypothetical protein